MDFFNRLLNRPPQKPAICQGSAADQENATANARAQVSTEQQQQQQQQQQHNPEQTIHRNNSREYPESTTSGPSSLVPESLSSASSFQSLASTLSSKSSSGICADSVPGSPEKPAGFDQSYVNVDIPDLDDIISACAGINLNGAHRYRESADSPNSSSGDLSQDQTFASAADETLSNETQIYVEESIQTFKTCPTLEPAQINKIKSSSSEHNSSLIPYVSFEQSVLRKHQSNGVEVENTHTAFQAVAVSPRRRSFSPTPCVEIDVAAISVKTDVTTELPNREIQLEFSCSVNQEGYSQQNAEGLWGSPDVSFQEVQAFDSENILKPETVVEKSNRLSDPPKCLNVTITKTENDNEIKTEGNPDGYTLKEGENTVDTFEKDKDVLDEIKLNKSEIIVEETNILNKTQNIEDLNNLNKSNEIIQEQNNLNTTVTIVQENKTFNEEEIIVKNENKNVHTEETNVKLNVSSNHNIDILDNEVKSSKLTSETKTLDPNCNVEEIKEQENKISTSVTVKQEQNEAIITNEFKTPNKEDINSFRIPKTPTYESSTNEESQNSQILNTEVTASTPLPEKNKNKVESSKHSRRKSALFTNGVKSPEIFSSEVIDQQIKSPLKNRVHFDHTALNNKSWEKSSFNASELITKDNLEATHLLSHEDSLNLLQQHEPEYEAFKPQQQSTALPYPNYKALQEAALCVAQDIDASLEKIEESEQFVSATTELFEDPSALDFLNQAGSRNSKRGERYDSLYIKFDPLCQRESMLPQKNLPTPPMLGEEDVKEANADTTNSNIVTPKKNPALAAIDRLLFYSPNVAAPTETPVTETKQKKEEVEKPESQAIPVVDEKMANELELVRSTVLQLEKELEKQKQENDKLQKHKSTVEEKFNHMQTKLSQMQTQLTQEIKCKDQMTVVVEEYEKSISRLIAEREKDRTNFEAEKAKLQEELQVANQHLSNTEAAFTDVHSKYERLKNVVSAYKSNETVLKESIAENQETIKTLENRYEQLKGHAMAQLEKANQELSSIRKQNEAETVKLKALVRKAELKSKSLEETVEQKMKENKELTQIIDEMIARVD